MTATGSVRRYGAELSRMLRLDRAAERIWFGWKVREGLYRHMAVQIENDIAQLAALESFRRRLLRKKKTGSAKVIASIERRMGNGASLAASFKTLVPSDEALVIMGGETAGEVGQAFTLILDAKQRLAGVRRTMVSAFITPFVYLAAVYALLWSIGALVLPTVTKLVPASAMTGLGGLVVALGTAATSWWLLIPAAAVAAAVGWIWWALPNWTGRLRIRMEGVFPFNFYRDLQGYVWTLTFSSMLKAGVPDTQILAEQAKYASPWLRQRLVAIRQKMANGQSLGAALAVTKFDFPNPDLIDDIASMGGFVDFPERMRRRAIQWSDELQWITTARLRTIGVIFDLIMYAIMGLVIGGINSMSGQLGSVTTLH
jgi:type II secretory pathway component PulF